MRKVAERDYPHLASSEYCADSVRARVHVQSQCGTLGLFGCCGVVGALYVLKEQTMMYDSCEPGACLVVQSAVEANQVNARVGLGLPGIVVNLGGHLQQVLLGALLLPVAATASGVMLPGYASGMSGTFAYVCMSAS